MKLSERLEALVRNACPGWHAAETIREAAEQEVPDGGR